MLKFIFTLDLLLCYRSAISSSEELPPYIWLFSLCFCCEMHCLICDQHDVTMGWVLFNLSFFFLTPTDLLPTGEEQVGCWWGTLTWQIVICYLYQGATGNIWPLSREETLFSWTCYVRGEEFNPFESDNGVFLYQLLQLYLQIRDLSLLPPSALFHYDHLFATCS